MKFHQRWLALHQAGVDVGEICAYNLGLVVAQLNRSEPALRGENRRRGVTKSADLNRNHHTACSGARCDSTASMDRS